MVGFCIIHLHVFLFHLPKVCGLPVLLVSPYFCLEFGLNFTHDGGAPETCQLLFLRRQVQLFIGLDGLPGSLTKYREVRNRQIVLYFLVGKDIPIGLRVHKFFAQAGYVFIKFACLALPVPAYHNNFDFKKFFRFIIVCAHLFGFLQFPPQIVDIPNDLAAYFIFVVVLVIEIPNAVEDGLGGLLAELVDADVHDDLEGLVLRPSVLA